MNANKNTKRVQLKIKAPDEVLKGIYANSMIVTHTREEFILDFLTVFPPQGILNARIIIGPGHLKRIIKALQDNLAKYETRFGQVQPAPSPEDSGGAKFEA